jgi:hypothetical protein
VEGGGGVSVPASENFCLTTNLGERYMNFQGQWGVHYRKVGISKLPPPNLECVFYSVIRNLSCSVERDRSVKVHERAFVTSLTTGISNVSQPNCLRKFHRHLPAKHYDVICKVSKPQRVVL